MARKFTKFMLGPLLLGLSTLGSAAVIPIDIFNVSGVGFSGYTTTSGPCYCEESAYLSPIMVLQPGTYDFGKVREYWDLSDDTPDGGPNQPNFYLLFAPLITYAPSVSDFPQRSYSYPGYPSTWQCELDDAACNAMYSRAYVDFDLLYTVAPGETAVQVELVSNYEYTSPISEPFPSSMFVFGLAVVAGVSAKRGWKTASSW